MTHRHPPSTLVVTDGACSGNGTDASRGGWAAIVIAPDGSEVVITGAEAPSTNNRMELMAAIEGSKKNTNCLPKRLRLENGVKSSFPGFVLARLFSFQVFPGFWGFDPKTV